MFVFLYHFIGTERHNISKIQDFGNFNVHPLIDDTGRLKIDNTIVLNPNMISAMMITK